MKLQQKGFFFPPCFSIKTVLVSSLKDNCLKDASFEDCTNFDATAVLSQRTKNRLWGAGRRSDELSLVEQVYIACIQYLER